MDACSLCLKIQRYGLLQKIWARNDKNATKNIFLSIPVYAHGGIPYLALLVILRIDHQSVQQNLVLHVAMISCLKFHKRSSLCQKAKSD
jgi:hypothetical protein